MNGIRGMLLPMPTVFEEDGSIDDRLMCELVERYIGAGVNALLVGGSFGQGPALSQEERKHLSEIVLTQTRKRVPVVIHIGTADPYTTIDLGRHALKAGADAVACVGPYYYADHTPDEVRAHFKMVGAALTAPIMLYNNPKYQGYAMTPDLMGQLRQDSPQIFGVKLAMGSIDEAKIYQEVLGREFKFFALASSLFPGMRMGIAGTVSPPLATFPELGVELVRAIDRRDYVRALELQEAVIEFSSSFLSRTVARECGRAIYRVGLQQMGIAVKRYPRWPTGEVSPARREWFAELYRAGQMALARKAA